MPLRGFRHSLPFCSLPLIREGLSRLTNHRMVLHRYQFTPAAGRSRHALPLRGFRQSLHLRFARFCGGTSASRKRGAPDVQRSHPKKRRGFSFDAVSHPRSGVARRCRPAAAPRGGVLSPETARATPAAAGEPQHHSRRSRYPRMPTAASCSATVASTSSSTRRSFDRRGTLFFPRHSIHRAKVPTGTTCITGGAIVLRRLAS